MEPPASWSAAVALLLVFTAALWLWIRARGISGLQGRRARGPVEIVQRLPLTAQHSLHVVRAGHEALWIVTFPSGATVLRSTAFEGLLEAAASRCEGDPR